MQFPSLTGVTKIQVLKWYSDPVLQASPAGPEGVGPAVVRRWSAVVRQWSGGGPAVVRRWSGGTHAVYSRQV